MRVTVSLPDELFRLAQTSVRRLRISKSELYARAVTEFPKRQDENTITEQLNRVYSRQPAKVESRLRRVQLISFELGRLVELREIHGKSDDWFPSLVTRGYQRFGGQAMTRKYGCVTTGKTLDETERNIREAIRGHLATLHEFGELVPGPASIAREVEISPAA
jgi:hypothetical protein